MSLKTTQNDYLEERELKEYVQRTQEFIENHPNINEPETKSVFVEPLIDLLGWDKFKGEVKKEYSVEPFGSKRSTSSADYALLLEDVPVIFIEAKKLGADISSHAGQAIGYGRVEGVKWVAATNGKRIEIFNTEKGKDRKSCLLKSIPLEKYIEERETLSLLSKKAIKEGKIEEFDKKIRSKRKSIQNLKNSQEELEEEIYEMVKDKVDDSLYEKIEGLIPTLVDDLIKRIEGEKETTDKETTGFESSEEVDVDNGVIELNPEDNDDLTHTTYIEGEVGNEIVTGSWTDLLGLSIEKAITEEEMEPKKLRRLTKLNIVEGKETEKGYKYLKEANVSFQRKPASVSWEECRKILKKLNQSAIVEFKWKPKEEALYPGKRGKIKWP